MGNSHTPLLTIVIPVHAVEQYLSWCLESVLSERADDFEVLAIDDCSPDDSGEILDKYSLIDSRLRVIHLAENVGLGGARNIGIDQARGEYLWFVDSDDWLPEGSVRAVIDRLVAGRPDVLMVDHIEVFDRDGRTRHRTPAGALCPRARPTTVAARPQLLDLMHSACTKIVRRGLLAEIGLRFHPGLYEDVAYSHPVLVGAQRVDTLDQVCYCYRQRARGGITKTVSERHFDVFDQYARMFATVEQLAGPQHEFAPRLFRGMIDHYLVIAGNDRRLSPGLRRSFFRRAAQDFRNRLPRQGYPRPAGVAGLKHRLLRHDAYRAYLLLRLLYRLAGDGMARLPVSGIPAQRAKNRWHPVGRLQSAADTRRAADVASAAASATAIDRARLAARPDQRLGRTLG